MEFLMGLTRSWDFNPKKKLPTLTPLNEVFRCIGVPYMEWRLHGAYGLGFPHYSALDCFSGNICRVYPPCRTWQEKPWFPEYFPSVMQKKCLFQKHCLKFQYWIYAFQNSEVFNHFRMTQTYSDHIGPTRQTILPRRVLLRDCSLIRPEGAFCQKKSLSGAIREKPNQDPLG